MEDAGKRKPEDGDGTAQPERKRRRWDTAEPAAAAPAAAAPAAPAAAAAAAKASAVLQKSSELQEKLAKLRQLKEQQAAKGAAGAAPAPARPAAPAVAPAVPAALQGILDPAALAKVQAIAAQLAARGGVQPAAAVAAAQPPTVDASGSTAARPPAGFRPPVLRLDAQGREIDENGNLVEHEVVKVSTLRVNQRAQNANVLEKAMQEVKKEAQKEEESPFFDPRMGGGGRRKDRSALSFVDPGTFQRQAELMRIKQQFGSAGIRQLRAQERRAREKAERRAEDEAAAAAAEAGDDPNLVPLGARPQARGGAEATHKPPPKEIPDIEWWDAPLVPPGTTYATLQSGEPPLLHEKVTIYVEHPVPRDPPAEAPPPPPQPLKLTKKEQKKLRTQRRVAREKERQEMVKQGLLEPPKPKVKVSNLMRVLTDQAAADPTAIEMEVRKQMAERADAHMDRNLARKLTPAEKAEKKERKLFADTTGEVETICCVYRVEKMTHPQNKYKVSINAEENRLTGVCLICDSFAIVIVEGVKKAITRYNKLMTRRIDWSLKEQKIVLEGREQPEESDDDDDGTPNKCTLVWQGGVLQPAFRKWQRFETVRTEAAAAKYLEDLGLRHYWDLAAAGAPADDILL